MGTGFETATVAIACLAMLTGGVVKGLLGVGLPIIALAIMVNFIDPKLALGIITLPLFASNTFQVWRAGGLVEMCRRFWPIALVFLTALWFSTGLVPDLDSNTILAILGAAVVIFAITSLWRQLPELPGRAVRPVGIVAGALSGVVGGISTVWGPPLMMYFIALRLPRNTFVQAAGLMWFIGGFPLVGGYIANGILTASIVPLSALTIVPAIAGFWLGERVRDRIEQDSFRKLLLVAFAVIGLNLIRRAFMSG